MPLLWTPQFKQQDVTILKEVEVFSSYSKIKQFLFTFSLFQGNKSDPIARELIVRPPAVAVLLYDPDQDKVVLIEQFRTGAVFEKEGPWLLEIVAGLVEPEETVEASVHREVKEETNCKVLSLISIGSYLVSPGISNEKIFLFCARVQAPTASSIEGIQEEGENIKVHVFKTEAAFQLLQEGKILSSPTVMALQWLKINRLSLHFPQYTE